MNIPTSKNELLAALISGTAKLRRDVVEFLSKKPKTEFEPPASNPVIEDDSIIDVTNQFYVISQPAENQNNQSDNLKQSDAEVPFWEHHYIYSYSEINAATKKQREFYSRFKIRFLREEFVDLEGNTNYAFVLLFDLLDEYENHKNISDLENQLQRLGQFYPKTKPYTVSFLARKMKAEGDAEGAARISYEYQNTYYDYWKLGNKYKTKLNLRDKQVELLNKLSYSSNNFCSIEYCCVEVIKLYLSIVTELTSKYNQEQTSLEEQFTAVADIIARKHFRYRLNSQNYKYCLETTPDEIYSIIFKHCENAVREHYGHKRKINVDGFYTHAEIKVELEARIAGKIREIISATISRVALPDEATEIELYAQNTNRWKIKFGELTTSYTEDGKQFIDSILQLGKLNKKNPSVENIFFEASKFVSKTDSEAALALYLYYLHHDLNSATFDHKQLTKSIQKSLFKTNQQLNDFQAIVTEFCKDKNLANALQKVPAIYAQKRKKIQLNSAVIKEVEERHSGTVELLNEYLQDEEASETLIVKSRTINNEEVKIEIAQKSKSPENSIFAGEIALTPIHQEVLKIFFKNSLTLSPGELESFAKERGVFKNQLIDSLNEICYETLDDVLIEEDDQYYTISENYYRKLLAS